MKSLAVNALSRMGVTMDDDTDEHEKEEERMMIKSRSIHNVIEGEKKGQATIRKRTNSSSMLNGHQVINIDSDSDDTSG